MRSLVPPMSFLLRDGAVESSGSLEHTPFTIGRSPDRDVVLTHPYVSRQHAAIVFEGDRFYITDQGSRHGTFVNGLRVSRHPLADRDSIHFGAVDGPSLTFGTRAIDTGSTLHQILDQLPVINASGGLEKLRWFFESARKLNTFGAVDQILAVLLETTLQLTSVERGYVFLRNAQGELELALGRGAGGEPLLDDGSLSRSAIEKARRTVSEYIVTDTFSEEAIARSESVVAHHIRTVICIPLRNRRHSTTSAASRSHSTDEGSLLGLLYLDSRLTVGSLTQIDSDLLRTIATEAAALIDNAQLAIAEQNERRYREELTIAAQIQQGLMAVKLPDLPYATIAARSVPCTQVGGDFYDVVLDGDSVSVVIADVSGKGISAAILASTLQGMIYSQLLSRQPLAQIAQVVNHYICLKNIHKYATLAVLRVSPDGHLDYINCGHIQPLVCFAGHASRLTEANLPVGLLPEAVFSSSSARLEPGTRVLLTTDGVTEAENSEGEFFGEERLQASVDQCSTIEQIYQRMQTFCDGAPAADDCTMLELAYHGLNRR